MVEYDRGDLVCLYLAAHDDVRTRSEVSLAVTATGIGDALEVGDSTARRVRLLNDLAALEEAGLVATDERPVRDRTAPRTVYFLTDAAGSTPLPSGSDSGRRPSSSPTAPPRRFPSPRSTATSRTERRRWLRR